MTNVAESRIRAAVIGLLGLGFSMAPAGSAEFSPETDFVTRAATANMAATEESRLALNRSADPKVKAFARRLLGEHQTAEAALQAAAQKSGATIPAALDPEQQQRLAALRGASRAGFDKLYLADQVAVHSNVLTLYADYMLLGDNQKLKALSIKMIPIVQAELKDAVALSGD